MICYHFGIRVFGNYAERTVIFVLKITGVLISGVRLLCIGRNRKYDKQILALLMTVEFLLSLSMFVSL